MIERLDKILDRYNFLETELTKQEVLSDVNKTKEYSKELANLEELIACYKQYKKVLNDIEEAKDMMNDPDLGEMAKEEFNNLTSEKEKLEGELEILLIPKDPNDNKNVVMEIRGAAGGDEANIFAGDLFRMYTRYAEKQGFKYDVYNSIEGTAGGYSQIEFIISGKDAYSFFKYESGSHRVQRVPVTEANGRLQTSTATVLAMPEVDDEIDIEINPGDLRIDIYRSSGKGGQGVNTTDSAVRITHLPTNTVVTCQNERSQIQNKEQAMKVLKSRLYEMKLQEQEEASGAERRNKIGTGDRAEKIRTYNYPQNRVTDHRIGFTSKNLDRIMDGDLNELFTALREAEQLKKLQGEESDD
ncbi:MAG: peptide chain release factor 1 [Bacilli bacterium]|nr:peptide chain release factor 1 [Bacilli bacterium]